MNVPETVWGVDVGLACTTICALRSGSEPLFHQAITTPEDGEVPQRLAVLRRQVGSGSELLCRDGMAPLYVFVERPTGRFPNPHLEWACGVVTEAIYSALAALHNFPTSVWHVPVKTWKKEIVGSGNASKADVMKWTIGELGAIGVDQDRADAYAIARYALKVAPNKEEAA